jgi:hypothetical protein
VHRWCPNSYPTLSPAMAAMMTIATTAARGRGVGLGDAAEDGRGLTGNDEPDKQLRCRLGPWRSPRRRLVAVPNRRAVGFA